jgi:peroxiredoxin
MPSPMPLLLLFALMLPPQTGPDVPLGSMAPAFSLNDDRGTVRSLSEFKGRYVVLEWHEKGCPYVVKHYKGGAMQRRQAEWMGRGVVWLLINSSAEGFHSYLTPEGSREYFKGLSASPTAALLDTTGKVGKLYGVTTALHMLIVDPSGKVAYNGAIDDQPKTEASSLGGAKNYVDAALTELHAGKPVATPRSVPYGCDVHYAGNQ